MSKLFFVSEQLQNFHSQQFLFKNMKFSIYVNTTSLIISLFIYVTFGGVQPRNSAEQWSIPVRHDQCCGHNIWRVETMETESCSAWAELMLSTIFYWVHSDKSFSYEETIRYGKQKWQTDRQTDKKKETNRTRTMKNTNFMNQ